MRHVIIGNSYSAVFAIEAIRRIDSESEIMVISGEPYPVYARAAIHEYMYGAIGERQMYYRNSDFYKKNNVTPLLGKQVSRVEPAEHRVILKDGKKIGYDRLLISAGGIPVIPPINGMEGTKGIFTFTTWDDAKSLREWSKKQKMPRAVVLGGGLIGLQCAEGLRQMGVDVTVIELADYVLVKALDRRAAEFVHARFKENGIEIITGDTVTEVLRRKGSLSGVRLKSGGRIPCNTFVVSIGVRPNTGFLDGSGIKVERGIVVDRRMQTNYEGIFAAGDVVEAEEIISRNKEVLPIIPLATLGGKVAGSNMAGENKEYPGSLSQNALQFFGLNIISIGNLFTSEKTNGIEEIIRDEHGVYKKAVLKNGRLIYMVSVNRIERIGIFNTIIRSGKDVRNIKDSLLKDNFGWTDLPREFRSEMLTRPG